MNDAVMEEFGRRGTTGRRPQSRPVISSATTIERFSPAMTIRASQLDVEGENP